MISVFGIVSFLGAWLLQKTRTKAVFAVIIVLSLLPLLFYKYTEFICNSILHLNFMKSLSPLSPLGISFYTFQGIGYLIDVYRGKTKSSKNLLDYFTYLSLFTCVTSGPINRSKEMLEQIERYNESNFDYDRCVKGFQYVLLGFFLKVFLAGRMSTLVAAPYENVDTTQGLVLLIASICYTIQIFCDFCGYSYMAYGLSKIIGFDVIQNFRHPYASKTITEFWRRWHISLSSWLTEYIYIPLGGSRCSKLRSNINVLITFAVSGLWHGANWTFLIWGILNGLFIVMERMLGFAKSTYIKAKAFLHWLLTIILVNTMWIFFRANSLANAGKIIWKILRETVPDLFSLTSIENLAGIKAQFGVSFYELCVAVLSGAAFLIYALWVERKSEVTEIFCKKTVIRWMMYVGIVVITLLFGVTGKASEFIYAQF